jgi:hypothetical protein
MFLSDDVYARKYNLFGDWKIFFVWLLKTVRGEKGEYFGKTAEKSYAQTLLDEGAITQEDYDAVMESALSEEKELRDQTEN